MATHSSILAWKIPWTEEPVRLQSMGSQRIGHDWATLLQYFFFIRWPKYWSFTSTVQPTNIQDWFPLGLNVLISLLSKRLSSLIQHHNSKASIIWCSDFFMVQFSPPYMTTGKAIVLIIWTLVSKVMSLLYNVLSNFVIDFLPWGKYILISWLHSLSTVILEPKKTKSVTPSTFPLLFAMKWWDWMPWS